MNVEHTAEHVDKIVKSALVKGEVITGRLYATESSCSFQPKGLSIIETTELRNDDKFLSCTILVNDVIKDIVPVQQGMDGAAGDAMKKRPPLVDPPEAQSLAEAKHRELESTQRFLSSERKNVGVAVTQVAQKLFNSFYKQLPLDTKWANPGKSQDIIVLGVLITYPYSSSTACSVVADGEGQKSLQRISVMVKNFLSVPTTTTDKTETEQISSHITQ